MSLAETQIEPKEDTEMDYVVFQLEKEVAHANTLATELLHRLDRVIRSSTTPDSAAVGGKRAIDTQLPKRIMGSAEGLSETNSLLQGILEHLEI